MLKLCGGNLELAAKMFGVSSVTVFLSYVNSDEDLTAKGEALAQALHNKFGESACAELGVTEEEAAYVLGAMVLSAQNPVSMKAAPDVRASAANGRVMRGQLPFNSQQLAALLTGSFLHLHPLNLLSMRAFCAFSMTFGTRILETLVIKIAQVWDTERKSLYAQIRMLTKPYGVEEENGLVQAGRHRPTVSEVQLEKAAMDIVLAGNGTLPAALKALRAARGDLDTFQRERIRMGGKVEFVDGNALRAKYTRREEVAVVVGVREFLRRGGVGEEEENVSGQGPVVAGRATDVSWLEVHADLQGARLVHPKRQPDDLREHFNKVLRPQLGQRSVSGKWGLSMVKIEAYLQRFRIAAGFTEAGIAGECLPSRKNGQASIGGGAVGGGGGGQGEVSEGEEDDAKESSSESSVDEEAFVRRPKQGLGRR
jgi:hypothetical protein